MNGPIRRPVNFEYIWGDALAEWVHAGTDVRIINMETSIRRAVDEPAMAISKNRLTG